MARAELGDSLYGERLFMSKPRQRRFESAGRVCDWRGLNREKRGSAALTFTKHLRIMKQDGVSMKTLTLKNKFQQYKTLVQKPKLTDDDFEKIAELEMFLDEIPDYLALDITTEYQQLKEELAQREDI